MRMLVSTSAAFEFTEQYPQWFGWLCRPKKNPLSNYQEKAYTHLPFYADNDAFNNFSAEKYCIMLDRLKQIQICWVTAPDKVANAQETTKMFHYWIDKIHPLPVAYVLQDGVTQDMIPFDTISAVFLGGSTEFKLSPYAMNLLHYARSMNKLVHVGRVNSVKRIKLFHEVMHTFDGSGFARFAKRDIPKYIKYMEKQ